MAVTLGTVGPWFYNGGSDIASGSISTTLDVGTPGTDRCVIVAVRIRRPDPVNSSVATADVGGVSLNFAEFNANQNGFWSLWVAYATESDLGSLSGTQTITVNIVRARSGGGVIGLRYDGVADGVQHASGIAWKNDSTTFAVDAPAAGFIQFLTVADPWRSSTPTFSPTTLTTRFTTNEADFFNILDEIDPTIGTGTVSSDDNGQNTVWISFAEASGGGGGPISWTDGALSDPDTLPNESWTSSPTSWTDGALTDPDVLPNESWALGTATSWTDGALTDPDILPNESWTSSPTSWTDGSLSDPDVLPTESWALGTATSWTDGALVDPDVLLAESWTLGTATSWTDGSLSDPDVVLAESWTLGTATSWTDGALVDPDVVPSESWALTSNTWTDPVLTDPDVLSNESWTLGTATSWTDGALVDPDVLPTESWALTSNTWTDGALVDPDVLPTESWALTSNTWTDPVLADPDVVPSEAWALGTALQLTDGALTDPDVVPSESWALGSLTWQDPSLSDPDVLPGEAWAFLAGNIWSDPILSDPDVLPGESLVKDSNLSWQDDLVSTSSILPAESWNLSSALSWADDTFSDSSFLPGEDWNVVSVQWSDGALESPNFLGPESILKDLPHYLEDAAMSNVSLLSNESWTQGVAYTWSDGAFVSSSIIPGETWDYLIPPVLYRAVPPPGIPIDYRVPGRETLTVRVGVGGKLFDTYGSFRWYIYDVQNPGELIGPFSYSSAVNNIQEYVSAFLLLPISEVRPSVDERLYYIKQRWRSGKMVSTSPGVIKHG